MQQRPQGQVLLGISDGKQTETEFLALGLSLGGYGTERQHVREVLNHTRFRALYGIGPKSAAALWKDLKASNDKARKEGFFLFLNWLKEYRSYHGLGGLWNLDEDTIATKVWWYAKAVQSLKPNKIKFEGFGSDEIFIATVDGVHCRINEPRTDAGTKWYSHKFNGPGVCYEIAISIRRDNVLWISGPHCASVHDITIFRGGKKTRPKNQNALFFKIPDGKRVIGDTGYQGEPDKVSVTKDGDSKDVKKFFARAKSRQETFNSRLKAFQILETSFRHGFNKHASVFESVCIIIQYDMENGHPLFEI